MYDRPGNWAKKEPKRAKQPSQEDEVTDKIGRQDRPSQKLGMAPRDLGMPAGAGKGYPAMGQPGMAPSRQGMTNTLGQMGSMGQLEQPNQGRSSMKNFNQGPPRSVHFEPGLPQAQPSYNPSLQAPSQPQAPPPKPQNPLMKNMYRRGFGGDLEGKLQKNVNIFESTGLAPHINYRPTMPTSKTYGSNRPCLY